MIIFQKLTNYIASKCVTMCCVTNHVCSTTFLNDHIKNKLTVFCRIKNWKIIINIHHIDDHKTSWCTMARSQSLVSSCYNDFIASIVQCCAIRLYYSCEYIEQSCIVIALVTYAVIIVCNSDPYCM